MHVSLMFLYWFIMHLYNMSQDDGYKSVSLHTVNSADRNICCIHHLNGMATGCVVGGTLQSYDVSTQCRASKAPLKPWMPLPSPYKHYKNHHSSVIQVGNTLFPWKQWEEVSQVWW